MSRAMVYWWAARIVAIICLGGCGADSTGDAAMSDSDTARDLAFFFADDIADAGDGNDTSDSGDLAIQWVEDLSASSASDMAASPSTDLGCYPLLDLAAGGRCGLYPPNQQQDCPTCWAAGYFCASFVHDMGCPVVCVDFRGNPVFTGRGEQLFECSPSYSR